MKLLRQSKALSLFNECPDEIITISPDFEQWVCKELMVHILTFIMTPNEQRDELFRDFMELEGVQYIRDALIELKDNTDELDCRVIMTILKLLNQLPINFEVLKATQIGKHITPLKNHAHATIKNQSNVLEKKWRTIAEN